MLATLAMLSACSAEKREVSPCPLGFQTNSAREAAIKETLTRFEEGKQLYDEASAKTDLRFCFGAIVVSSVTTEGALLLDTEQSNEEITARIGHLLRHVRDGLSARPKKGERCEETSERLLIQEAEALHHELTLREALDVKSPKIRYEIEPAWKSASNAFKEKRVAILLDYLKAHPDGAPGIEALAKGYERRCRRGLP